MAESSENQYLAQAIDHTKLTFAEGENEEATIAKLCEEAKLFGFYAVCVRPQHVKWAKEYLKNTPVHVAAVIGFPPQKVKLKDELEHPTIGNWPFVQKAMEAQQAILDGADELDWVINNHDLKMDVAQGTQRILEELNGIHPIANGKTVKIIIETDLLSVTEILMVTRWCAETGMGMVKTSTGMIEGGRGATIENVKMIQQLLQALDVPTGIKASGGIKTRDQALAFLKLGVNRIGTSSGVSILQNALSFIEQEIY